MVGGRSEALPPVQSLRIIGHLWAPVRSCLNLAGLKLLMGLGRRALDAVAVGA